MIIDDRPTVSAVIRSFNEERGLPRLLHGLSRQTYPPSEVILVDSGSTDSTVLIAEQFGCKVVHIEQGEFSFGRALNVGLAEAAGEIALLASAHVYPVYDSWIAELVRPFRYRDRVAISYGRQVTPPNGRYSEGRLLEQWFPATSNQHQTAPFHNNANAAVRRDVWRELPYDEELTGLEDLDFGKRALAEGYEIAYIAEAMVVHVHDESVQQIINRYRREAIAHKNIYPDQAMSAARAIRLALANVLGDLRAAATEGRTAKVTPDVVRFRAAQFLGSWQGFSQRGPMTEELHRHFYFPAATGGDRAVPVATSVGSVIHYIDTDEAEFGTRD